MRSILNHVYKIATTIVTVFVIITAVGFFVELSEPPSDYFTHYGNITLKDAFMYPEVISVYAFGDIDEGTQELNATHRLFCVSADSVSRLWVLIGTQYGVITTISEFNNLPSIIQAKPIGDNTHNSDLGVSTRNLIDQVQADGQTFFVWKMEGLKPDVVGSCYIRSTITARTTLFDLQKSITFNSIEFSYLYPNGVGKRTMAKNSQ